mmetsp:Transcript_22269/g.53941  ORF Transcript_22269/g.53941 Transcript_22269/m.53941 type:complete len:487 (-) Transcript_22269:266-1726(-)
MTVAKLNVRSPVATPPAAESPALSSEAEAASLSPRTGLLQREQQQPCADPAEALDLINVELGRVREARPDCALFRAHARRPQLLDDAHKKAFLHAESYVVKAAADRMVAYWEARADLFGEEGMLCAMDKSGALKGEDSVALDQGMLQLLPVKDLDSRGLLFYDPSRHDPKLGYSNESMLRVIWYILHVAMEDPLTKENGFVLIVYPKKCTPEQINRDIIAKGTAIVGSLMPLPWRGFHICHPCSSYNKYFPLVKMLAPTSIKDNIAVHFGTDEHVLQRMASYSLPADRLPTEVSGRVELDYKKWVADRKQAEGGDALRAPTPRSEAESADELMEDVPTSPRGGQSGKVYDSVRLEPTTAGKAKTGKAKAKAGAAKAKGGSAPPRTSSAASPPVPDTSAKTRRPGRKGDARMHKAVTTKIESPETSLVEALQEGGFNFDGLNEKGRPHHEVFDQDGVSLMQRKNQLLRRIRVEKKKKKDEAAQGDDK